MAIGWALVSLGSHAETFFAPAITGAAGAQLVAVYSRDPARAAAFAAAHGAHAAYTSLEPLLADARVDVVWIAAPNFLHAPYTIRAARARKHVLVEKPMAISVAEAMDMVQTCQAQGVKLGVGFHLRHHPGHQEARRLIREGCLGTLTLVYAQWGGGLRGQVEISPTRLMAMRSGERSAWWETPEMIGGAYAMMASGVHCVDLLCFLLNQHVVEVAALTDGQTPEQPLERLATLCLRFSGGTLGTVCCGFKMPDAKNDATLYGSHGRIVLDNSLWITLRGALEVVSATVNTTVVYPQDPLALYTRQVEAFNQAIQHDDEPSASGRDGLHVVQVTRAMIEGCVANFQRRRFVVWSFPLTHGKREGVRRWR
jgi:1,5-anhydro-D-fructose reductase (1,5-anhydro-D-mannitol-forming)